jgi:hypothetical protein
MRNSSVRELVLTAGSVNEELLNPAPQSERLTLLSRFSDFLSGLLDGLSFLVFCVSFSTLTHVLSSWWNRLLPGD